MVDPEELTRTVLALAGLLDEMGVAWAIGGSVASAAWGEPRATNDLDVVARMDPEQAREFAQRLADSFYVDADVAAESARRGGSFNLIDERSFIKVDVFVPLDGPLGAGQLERRRRLELFPGRAAVPILGPEDVVLQKLSWFAQGGEVSDRQWTDIVGVLRLAVETLDDAYLDRTAAGAGLHELLARARAQAHPALP
jgi:hypothetical protein